ncbi:MAG: lysylphosphatidylglycerol synthase transmembrane domain-containing protein [Cyanobacteriota bacterium]
MKKYLRLIGILLFVIILTKINIADVWQSLLHADWYILSFAAMLNLLVIILRSFRWVKLLEIQNYSFGFAESFWSYLRSLYFGNITPARVGELSRVHYVMKYLNINSAVATSGVIFDRVLDSYFVLILGVIGIFFSAVWGQYISIKVFLVICMFLIPIFLFVPDVTLTLARFVPNYWNMREKFISWARNFFDAIKCFLNLKSTVPVLLTVIIYILFFIQCILLAVAMNLQIDMFYLILCVVVFSALSILPISISNMGTRESTLIFMFSYVGIVSEQAITYSILFFLIINLFLALFGWLAFVFYTDKVDKLDSGIGSVKNLCKEHSANKISN